MIKALIVDDEEGARKTLSSLLSEYCTDVSIVGECSNVPDAVIAINKLSPDLVFLDIEMPEYNGFELISFFKEINFEIVFVTAYSHYAIRAFEVSAIDYIVKPVEIQTLSSAIDKVRKKIGSSNIMQRIDLMKQVYSGNDIRKIALPMSDGMLFVDLNEIVFFEADRAYSHVTLVDGSKITVSKPMRVFEDILNNRNFLFRPHRSFLINLNYIKKYHRGESIITMDNNTQIVVARERKQDFENLLKELRLAI
ncbi:MAG: LytR/AlgR family response regulator transcription factor [Bacteroidia bacterium]